MFVLRGPGEVYLQGGARPFQSDESFGWLERVDPITLEPSASSPRLPSGGHNWCGGVVVHENGDLYMVNGRYCHRLSPDCEVVAERELPVDNAYNGLLVMSDGNLLMKDIQRDRRRHSTFSILEPESLSPLGEPFPLPENSVGRFSSDVTADGEFVYVSSDTKLYRLRYRSGELSIDDGWIGDYDIRGEHQSFGWDSCIGGDSIWMMDMGDGLGVRALLDAFPIGSEPPGSTPYELPSAAIRVFRFSVRDAAKRDVLVPFGIARAGVPAPPLYDHDRKIVVAFDSANHKVGAWRFEGSGEFRELWVRNYDHSTQMLLYAKTGELVLDDNTAAGDDAVVVDIESGTEKGRVATGAPRSSGMFFTPGFDRDFYYATAFGQVARISVL
jgi:hypothetical protein